jgi:hypothetical protein
MNLAASMRRSRAGDEVRQLEIGDIDIIILDEFEVFVLEKTAYI